MFNILIEDALKDREDVKSLVDGYTTFAKQASKEILDEFGVEPDVTIEAYDTRGQVTYRVMIKRPGEKRPDIAVRRRQKGDSLNQNLFEINPALQGRGLSKKLHKAQLPAAIKAGVKKYSVAANLDVGGYAWLRSGYKPDSYYEVVASIVDDTEYNGKYAKELSDIYRSGDEDAARKFIKKRVAARDKNMFLGTYWNGSVGTDDKDFLKWVGATKTPTSLVTPAQLAARHQVFLQQYAGRLYNDLLPILDEAEKQVLSRVMATDWQTETYSKQLKEIRKLKELAWAEFNGELEEKLKELAEYETEYNKDSLSSLVNVEISGASPKAVWAASQSNPFTVDQYGGQSILSDFLKDWSEKDIEETYRVIQGAMFTGVNRREMRSRIQGIKPQANRAARILVRTSLNHISATARDETYKENDDVVIGYGIVATLDRGTTAKCRGLDGQQFLWGDKPLLRPPFHPGCRTTTEPLLKPEFDVFNSGATRSALDGPVPSDTTYYGWLKNEPVGVQEEIIGKNRSKLLRDGGLTAEQFRKLSTDELFEPRTLSEMMEADRKFGYGAFKKAGVEPPFN